ncbi:MAG TPA: type II toxin-antitoxin system RelE/ParE family toxin [Acidobacteriaceae bacterium]|nr:type II toxin-antitoxin system RelE/ParE family toxin [Acidobacteriaceae bacterium]
MKIVWTSQAALDLNGAVDFIAAANRVAAHRVGDTIYNRVMQLAKMPQTGRLGLVPGTRELVFHP